MMLKATIQSGEIETDLITCRTMYNTIIFAYLQSYYSKLMHNLAQSRLILS